MCWGSVAQQNANGKENEKVSDEDLSHDIEAEKLTLDETYSSHIKVFLQSLLLFMNNQILLNTDKITLISPAC